MVRRRTRDHEEIRMLLNQATLRGVETGAITLAFRRWKRPTVKAGGTLLTSIGQLAIEAVDVVQLEDITRSDASAAGFATLESLRTHLTARSAGDIFRVRMRLAGPDPRVALRRAIPDGPELEALAGRLERLDHRAASGPWTTRVLTLIGDRPAERAVDLARDVGMERPDFKANVRKLKALGLTESLARGYRLSPRGRAVLARLRD
jgi:hypothetical protein